jgi:hypothetical protein
MAVWWVGVGVVLLVMVNSDDAALGGEIQICAREMSGTHQKVFTDGAC